MRASLLALVLAIVPSAIGCGDDIKFPDPTELPPPALNGVFPAKGFTDRTLRVEISGDGTAFDTASTATFGAGITVNGALEVSSTGTLFANITIAGDAALGKRDVTVTSGADSLVLTQAFEVQNPLEVFVDGPQLQGGIGSVLIVNHDPENPFLGDIAISGGNGVTIFVNDGGQGEQTLQATAFYDTDATSGQIVVMDSLLDTVTSRGTELTVTPRTATALQAPGKGPSFQAVNATLTETTSLFSFTGEDAVYLGEIFNSDQNAAPPVFIWLVNGKWAQARGFDSSDFLPMTDGQNMFVTVFNFGETGTVFDLIVDEHQTTVDATALAEVEDNDALTGTAQDITADVTFFTGATNDLGIDAFGDPIIDFDDLAVTLNDGDQIRVTVTEGSTSSADPFVIVFDDTFFPVDGNGLQGFAAQDDFDLGNGNFGASVTSVPLPAGNYFVEISPSSVGFGEPYEAVIEIIRANINE